MARKFNPAPGWPTAPEGWLPPEGWEPDPSWPAAPEGWQLLIDDGAPEGAKDKMRVWGTKAAAAAVDAKGKFDERRRFQAEQAAQDAGAADAARTAEGVLWSAIGRPVTGIGAGRYRLTTTTLYFEKGTLSTNAQQVPIVNVLDVDMRQSMTQKARGVGDILVHIQRPSRVEIVTLEDVPEPRAGVTAINNLATEARLTAQQRANTQHFSGVHPFAAPAPAAAPPADPPVARDPMTVDPMEQLRKLAELRDAGILTDDEFAAKKAEILSRL